MTDHHVQGALHWLDVSNQRANENHEIAMLTRAQVHATLALVDAVKALASNAIRGNVQITPLTESISGPSTRTADGFPTF